MECYVRFSTPEYHNSENGRITLKQQIEDMQSPDAASEQRSVVSRLGDCEVCGDQDAVYTCPKCEVKTCCLACVRIHKKELDCDGVRDRTKFIRLKDFSDMDLLSDYRLLEECARFTYGVKRNKQKWLTRIDRELPVHLFKLKMAARNRGTVLQFLTKNFTRHNANTTRYNFKDNIIYWRVEWIFPNAESHPRKFADDKCSEQTKVAHLLNKYLNEGTEPFDGSNTLSYYRSAGLNGVTVLLKAEKVPGSSHKYFELDPRETLAENLSGRCIIEFPIILVVLKDHAYNFDIIVSDDDSDEVNSNNKESSNADDAKQPTRRHRELLTEKIAKEKRMEIKKEIKEQNRKKPKNLLFTSGYSSEESLGDSDGV